MGWTKNRIQTLTKPEMKQLRANAERFHESEVVALCDEVRSGKAHGNPLNPDPIKR